MSSDRLWLTDKYFPELRGRILYVGVNDYTAGYPALVKDGSIYESLDSCPQRSKHGNSSHVHYNSDILSFNPPYMYDHIAVHGCHGHIGYNINNKNIREDIFKVDSLLKINGTLQFGPSTGYVKKYNAEYWEEFVNKSPFDKYELLHNQQEGPNYIWWGKKSEK